MLGHLGLGGTGLGGVFVVFVSAPRGPFHPPHPVAAWAELSICPLLSRLRRVTLIANASPGRSIATSFPSFNLHSYVWPVAVSRTVNSRVFESTSTTAQQNSVSGAPHAPTSTLTTTISANRTTNLKSMACSRMEKLARNSEANALGHCTRRTFRFSSGSMGTLRGNRCPPYTRLRLSALD
jgi:hypothetical protein